MTHGLHSFVISLQGDQLVPFARILHHQKAMIALLKSDEAEDIISTKLRWPSVRCGHRFSQALRDDDVQNLIAASLRYFKICRRLEVEMPDRLMRQCLNQQSIAVDRDGDVLHEQDRAASNTMELGGLRSIEGSTMAGASFCCRECFSRIEISLLVLLSSR